MADQEATTSTLEKQRRAGAMACIGALRTLATDAATLCDDGPSDLYEKQLRDAERFAHKLGPMSPYCEGVIIALAEYIHTSESIGSPSLDPGAWLPWVAKTKQERADDVSWLAACLAPDDPKEAGAACDGYYVATIRESGGRRLHDLLAGPFAEHGAATACLQRVKPYYPSAYIGRYGSESC